MKKKIEEKKIIIKNLNIVPGSHTGLHRVPTNKRDFEILRQFFLKRKQINFSNNVSSCEDTGIRNLQYSTMAEAVGNRPCCYNSDVGTTTFCSVTVL